MGGRSPPDDDFLASNLKRTWCCSALRLGMEVLDCWGEKGFGVLGQPVEPRVDGRRDVSCSL